MVLLDIVINVMTAVRGPRDPWKAGTLEWAMMLPPPAYNFASLPQVSGPEPLTRDPDLTGMLVSDIAAGVLVMIGSFLALSWRAALVRWGVAAVAAWIMIAPLLVWAESAAAYLNGSLAGAVIFALAVCTRPSPGVGTMAATTGPTIPPGWDYSSSTWTQRMPVIGLAFIGLFVSRYLAVYQMGHVAGVWEPFFLGMPQNPQNGTEEIITSDVSEAWPVPDAGLGALTYLLEILIGFIGSSRRWRTMPWLVLIFGITIVPLGVVSITFIIIQRPRCGRRPHDLSRFCAAPSALSGHLAFEGQVAFASGC